MIATELKNRLDAVRWLCVLSGSSGSIVPGIAFFEDCAPPLFEPISLLTGGGTLALLIYALKKKRSSTMRRAVIYVFLGLTMVVGYGTACRYLSVTPPPGWPEERIQTGFHLHDWSLTDRARKFCSEHPEYSPRDLMLAFGAFHGHQVEKIWKPWSVIAAGLLLIVLFMGGFVLWTYGFALLGRSVSGS